MFDDAKFDENNPIYNSIRVVYITMKSMEAKSLLQNYVFRQDGRLLQKLRNKQVEPKLAEVKSQSSGSL
jgi:hypothetical protein